MKINKKIVGGGTKMYLPTPIGIEVAMASWLLRAKGGVKTR